jgi:hypothetical protein
MDDAEAIWHNDWRQGSILLPESLCARPHFQPALQLAPEDILIVLTQDCDLVQKDFAKEPFVEIIKATPIIGNPDGNFLYGKNPRIIQFPIGEQHFQASCHDRSWLDRRLLAQVKPSEVHVLHPSVIHLLREWVAKRYIRPAFPDEFNARIRKDPTGKALRRLLELQGHLFQDLYLFCDPADQELPPGNSYKIILWPAMSSQDYEDEMLRQLARQACSQIEAILAECPGIDVIECEVRHEGQITLDDLRYFKAWDFDHLTQRQLSA